MIKWVTEERQTRRKVASVRQGDGGEIVECTDSPCDLAGLMSLGIKKKMQLLRREKVDHQSTPAQVLPALAFFSGDRVPNYD